MAERIQRKRTKGWKMPPNTVYVGRPSKWGNPFEVGKDGKRSECLELYRFLLAGYLCISKGPEHAERQKKHQSLVRRAGRKELRGKNLACWCPLNKPCHADVLLQIANS